MGFNQHQRGTWVNEQCYMNHLLLGKQSHARQRRLLADRPALRLRHRARGGHLLPIACRPTWLMLNPKHRAHRREDTGNCRPSTINPKMGSHYVKIMRDLEDGSVKWAWVQVNNPWQTHRQRQPLDQGARARWTTSSSSSDAYPGVSAKVADLILPAAMIFEKWGAYGNAERRTQVWRQQVPPPGQARADIWQMLEFSKRFKLKDVWGEQKVPGLKKRAARTTSCPRAGRAQAWATRPEIDPLRGAVRHPGEQEVQVARQPVAKGHDNHVANLLERRLVPGKGLVRGIPPVRQRPWP